MKVGYVYDPIYLKHDTGDHVENAARLEAIMAHLEKTGLKDRLTPIKARAATIEEVSMVHTREHITHIREIARRSGDWVDPDTYVSSGSYDAALWAAGGTIEAVNAVVTGDVGSAFAMVRPPGHHATPGQAMGFCLFNNIAIAARHALAKYERIAIIDFDVHHGNGTQDAFYREPKVLYVSTHQYPHYPGTGTIEETGADAAKDHIVNIPLPAGCGDVEYQQAFDEVIVPATRRFLPDFILVSAGYDGHWADQLAFMQVSVTGFARMVDTIKALAYELCGGRLVLGLEGGYDLTALATSVKATFDVLLGNAVNDPLGPSPRRLHSPDITRRLKRVREVHHL